MAAIPPSTSSTGIHRSVPAGRISIPMRTMPKAPSFISTPACSMETAVGAATWPSGDQVWNGQRPARMPQPIMKNGKNVLAKDLSNSTSRRTAMSKVPAPASAKTAKMPMKISTDPPTSTMVSFIAPYSLLVLPQTTISRYMGSTASS